MEINTNFKSNDNIDYIGITPWAILVFGGSFVVASLSNDGLFLKISFLTFVWGIVSSFARIIFKDKLSFLRKNNKGYYDEEHKEWWRIYYYFQFLFILIFVLFLSLWLL